MENTTINQEFLQTIFAKMHSSNPHLFRENMEKVSKIHELVNDRFNLEQCERNFNIVNARYKMLPNRDKSAFLSITNLLFNNQLSGAETEKILNIIVFNLETMDEETDFLAGMAKANMGMDEGLSMSDEIDNPMGRFGYDPGNPIPVNGINMINSYFKRLRLITGESVSFTREGSTHAENLKWPVDKYKIFSSENTPIATLYVYAYHGSMSDQAPEGFKLTGL